MKIKALSKVINMGDMARLDTYETSIDGFTKEWSKKQLLQIVNPSTYVGIEVEVENIFKRSGFISLPEGYIWNNIEDNSLRNNGREFVSVPLKGNQISASIAALFKALNRDKTCKGYEFTDRTSIHIHINYRDSSVEELSNTLLLYLLVEPLLYNFVEGNRYKNIFCVPLKESVRLKALSGLFKSFEDGSSTGYECIYNWSKYSGLNLAPLTRYGTIEYRQLVGTDDQEKIITWINTLLKIKEYASKISYSKLKTTLLDMNTSSAYLSILNDMFGDIFPYNTMPNVHELLEESVMFIKEFYAYDVEDSKLFYVDADKSLENPFYKKCIAKGLLNLKKRRNGKPPQSSYENSMRANTTLGAGAGGQGVGSDNQESVMAVQLPPPVAIDMEVE